MIENFPNRSFSVSSSFQMNYYPSSFDLKTPIWASILRKVYKLILRGTFYFYLLPIHPKNNFHFSANISPIGLHQFAGGSSGPGFSLLCFDGKKNSTYSTEQSILSGISAAI